MTMAYIPTGPGTAASMYGSPAAPQPASTSSGVTTETNQTARTAPNASEAQSLWGRPTLWLVLILAAAIGLISFSVRIGKK
ncbi:MAG TPA: hypothetical protein VMR97_07895 [Acidimicrobiales bacterium]|nr:hypothetical protein [Acidimicrobiales bacterium]